MAYGSRWWRKIAATEAKQEVTSEEEEDLGSRSEEEGAPHGSDVATKVLTLTNPSAANPEKTRGGKSSTSPGEKPDEDKAQREPSKVSSNALKRAAGYQISDDDEPQATKKNKLTVPKKLPTTKGQPDPKKAATPGKSSSAGTSSSGAAHKDSTPGRNPTGKQAPSSSSSGGTPAPRPAPGTASRAAEKAAQAKEKERLIKHAEKMEAEERAKEKLKKKAKKTAKKQKKKDQKDSALETPQRVLPTRESKTKGAEVKHRNAHTHSENRFILVT